ncbi:MAG TPA: hypothetical protein VE778_00640 [Candidatus Bathyarchaeia archaeon]|nr:hypothetical protein [Candidatus Bathyarchaeia archaeon]
MITRAEFLTMVQNVQPLRSTAARRGSVQNVLNGLNDLNDLNGSEATTLFSLRSVTSELAWERLERTFMSPTLNS